MNFLKLLPVFISFLLLAAHFFREGHTVIVIILLIIPLLLLIRKPWVPWVMQAVLLLGAAEWLNTLYFIAQMRVEFGMPWVRMALIMGAVALFTACSGLVFWSKTLHKRYTDAGDKTPK
jgi:hypothetical protein